MNPPQPLRVVRGDRKGTQVWVVQLGQSQMRQQRMVMGLERPGSKIHYSANHRPALSSERSPPLWNQEISDQNKQNKTKQTPWPLVRERNIPTERPPLVDEI
jgi:hypothetical protein